MGKLKTWAAKTLFREFIVDEDIEDAGSNLKRDPSASAIKGVGLRMGDVTSKDFQAPEFDLAIIQTAYDSDGYVRQGVDKYVDQIFKEGYEIYSKNPANAEYIKQRLSFIAECTKIPTQLFFTELAEDIVKFSNCFIVKARNSDPNVLPPGVKVMGVGGVDPIAGYFFVNATTIKTKRDKFGTVTGYQQEVAGGDKPIKFKPEDVVHMYYKRVKGNSFGTPFLLPVLDDVRALRQAEDNVVKMMYRNIHPFNHVQVGTDAIPGTDPEIEDVRDSLENMDVEGGLVTSYRVNIKPIASDQVINAEPYLRYLEERVFADMGIPGILFGRGGTANRSTGDSMTSEMCDRIKAMQTAISTFINEFIIKELLLESGIDPLLNPDDAVLFKFKENDMNTMIKFENHTIFKYEHNAITEDEMRTAIGMDPITDRAKMFQSLVTQANAAFEASIAPKTTTAGTPSTNNKNKPTNQHGTKTAPKKTKDSDEVRRILCMIDEIMNELKDEEENDSE